MKVLLVEDNAINAIVSQSMLKYVGFDVVVAEDGRQAIDILRKEDFSVVLMDLKMPIMNGFEAVQEIRKDKTLNYKQNIPIIALTAINEDNKNKILDYGFDGYLVKPINTLTLLETIMSTIAK